MAWGNVVTKIQDLKTEIGRGSQTSTDFIAAYFAELIKELCLAENLAQIPANFSLRKAIGEENIAKLDYERTINMLLMSNPAETKQLLTEYFSLLLPHDLSAGAINTLTIKEPLHMLYAPILCFNPDLRTVVVNTTTTMPVELVHALFAGTKNLMTVILNNSPVFENETAIDMFSRNFTIQRIAYNTSNLSENTNTKINLILARNNKLAAIDHTAPNSQAKLAKIFSEWQTEYSSVSNESAVRHRVTPQRQRGRTVRSMQRATPPTTYPESLPTTPCAAAPASGPEGGLLRSSPPKQ